MFEILGIAGIAISMLAYVPQVVHLDAPLLESSESGASLFVR